MLRCPSCQTGIDAPTVAVCPHCGAELDTGEGAEVTLYAGEELLPASRPQSRGRRWWRRRGRNADATADESPEAVVRSDTDADASDADLSDADGSHADLSDADGSDADGSDADGSDAEAHTLSLAERVASVRSERPVVPPQNHRVEGLALASEPDDPGAPWWRHRRPPAPRANAVQEANAVERSDVQGGGEEPPAVPGAAETDAEAAAAAPRATGSGLLLGVPALAVAAVVLYSARHYDVPALGRYLVPIFAVLAVGALVPGIVRRHPEEPWLAKYLLVAVAVKIATSILRYQTLVDAFSGVGDAVGYDEYGTKFALGYAPQLEDLRRTNFVRWFTGQVYSNVGIDIVAGFIVFALIAFLGSYFWYRATADGVPFVNRKLYFILVFFAPSVVFWPSEIGKEALMNLGLGLMALGTVKALGGRLLLGMAIAAPGGWLLWVVRPHLLALVMVAASAAYFAGRKKIRDEAPVRSSLARPIGMVAMAFLLVFAATSAADVLGMEDLSLRSIEAELAEQTDRSSTGGSQFDSGDTHITPASLPTGLVTVILRPFPWEVESGFQILASVENAALALFILIRHRSLRTSLTQARRSPFLLYCWTLVLVYAVAFSSFANFGLLARQRSLVFPALFVLISLNSADESSEESPVAVDARRSGRARAHA